MSLPEEQRAAQNEDEAHLFLDTNVLIYYPALDGYDWTTKVQGTSKIVIHITEPVLEEIAKKKDMGETKRLRKRCNRLVKRISELLENEEPLMLGGGAHLIIDPHVPPMSMFPQLNAISADDRLLACALSFQAASSMPVTIVTADVSLALRAKLKGHLVKNITLPETERLPIDPDPDELEKRELQQRIELLTSAQPRFTLQFEDGASFLRVTQRRTPNDLYAEEITKKKEELPFATLPKNPPNTVSLEFFTQAEVNTYNSSLEAYFRKFEKWLLRCAEIINRSYDVTVSVSNVGTAPAFGVHLRLHFPDGLNLVIEDRVDNLLPKEPLPPEKPREWMRRLATGDWRIPIAQPRIADIVRTLGPEHISITKTNSFDVEWDAKKIRQRETKVLSKMVLIYAADPFSFTIPFELVADNLADCVNGSLHVHATKD